MRDDNRWGTLSDQSPVRSTRHTQSPTFFVVSPRRSDSVEETRDEGRTGQGSPYSGVGPVGVYGVSCVHCRYSPTNCSSTHSDSSPPPSKQKVVKDGCTTAREPLQRYLHGVNRPTQRRGSSQGHPGSVESVSQRHFTRLPVVFLHLWESNGPSGVLTRRGTEGSRIRLELELEHEGELSPHQRLCEKTVTSTAPERGRTVTTKKTSDPRTPQEYYRVDSPVHQRGPGHCFDLGLGDGSQPRCLY